MASDRVLTPVQVSREEHIFEAEGALRTAPNGPVVGVCKIGVSLKALLETLSERHARSGAMQLENVDLSTLTHVFRHQSYILWCSTAPIQIVIALKQGSTAESQLQAWYHALLLAKKLSEPNLGKVPDDDKRLSVDSSVAGKRKLLLAHVEATLDHTSRSFGAYAKRLRAAGWDLDVAALETYSGSRIIVAGSDGTQRMQS